LLSLLFLLLLLLVEVLVEALVEALVQALGGQALLVLLWWVPLSSAVAAMLGQLAALWPHRSIGLPW